MEVANQLAVPPLFVTIILLQETSSPRFLMSDLIESELAKLSRDDLNVVAKKLGIKGYRRGKKDDLISRIIVEHGPEQIRRYLSVSFWDRYHNHVYGLASLVGVGLTLLFYFLPSKTSGDSNRTHFSPLQDVKRTTKRVAIVDFSPTNSQEKLAWLGPTLSTSITNQLRHFPEVDVYAAEAFGNSLSTILEKKPDLKVLTGEFAANNDFLDIKARLIDGATGQELQSTSFHIAIQNFDEIRDRLSNLILSALVIKANLAGDTSARAISAEQLLRLEYLGRYKLHLKKGSLKAASRFLEAARAEGLSRNEYDYYKALLYEKQGATNLAMAMLTELTKSEGDNSIQIWKHEVQYDPPILEMQLYKDFLFVLHHNALSCVNNRDGKVLWDFKGNSLTALSFLRDKVYVGTRQGSIQELSIYDGTSLATITLAQGVSTLSTWDDQLIFTTNGPWRAWDEDYSIGLIDTTRHSILWTRQIQGFTYRTPAIANNHLYIGTIAGFIYALNLETLRFAWTVDANTQLFHEYFKSRTERINLFLAQTPLSVINGDLFVGGYGSVITRIDISNGSTKKTYPIEFGCWSKIMNSQDNLICASVENKVSAYNFRNSELTWQTYVGADKSLDEMEDSPLFTRSRAMPTSSWQGYSSQEGEAVPKVVVDGDTAYTTHKNLIYRINVNTGEVLWRYALPDDANGRLYGEAGALYVETKDQKTNAVYKITPPTNFEPEGVQALAHFKLGELYFAAKRFDSSATQFKAALAEGNYLNQAYKYLARIAEATSDKQSAIVNWQLYLESVGPIEEEYEAARNSLQKLSNFRLKMVSSPHWPGLFANFNDQIAFLDAPNAFMQANNEEVAMVIQPRPGSNFTPYVINEGLLIVSEDSAREGNDFTAQGHIRVELLDPVRKATKWTTEIMGGGQPGSPVVYDHKYLILGVSDNLVFNYEEGEDNLRAAPMQRSLYAFDLSSGKQVWVTRIDTSSGMGSKLLLVNDILISSSRAVAADGNAVFVGSGDLGTQRDEIVALSARTGEVRWTFKTTWNRTLGSNQSKDIFRDDLLSLTADSQFPLPGDYSGRPDVSFDRIKIEQSSNPNEIYSLAITTGEVKWKNVADNNTASFPSLAAEDVLFKSVSNNSETLVALDKETGKEHWRYELSNIATLDKQFQHELRFWWTRRWLFFHKLHIDLVLLPAHYPRDQAPLIYKDHVYCSFRNGKIAAFTINKKQQLWEYNIPSTDLSSPTLYTLPPFKNVSSEATKERIAVKARDGYTYYFAP